MTAQRMNTGAIQGGTSQRPRPDRSAVRARSWVPHMCSSLEARPRSTRSIFFIRAWSCGICLRAWLFARGTNTLPPSP